MAKIRASKSTFVAMHKDPEGLQKHKDMGFMEGWGTVADQLEEYIKSWS